jgi:hypothetical protein
MDKPNLVLKRAEADFANRGEQIEGAIAWAHGDLSSPATCNVPDVQEAALVCFMDGRSQGYWPEVLRKALWETVQDGTIKANAPPYTLDD